MIALPPISRWIRFRLLFVRGYDFTHYEEGGATVYHMKDFKGRTYVVGERKLDANA